MQGRLQVGIRRALRITGVLAVLVLALMLVAAAAVPLLDWNLAKPWMTARLSAVLNRDIRVDGPLSLSWGSGPDSESGIARWSPRLRLTAHQVTIGNTPWATGGPLLARAEAVDVTVSPWPLLHKHWQIADIRLSGTDVVMERASDTQKNWRFSSSEQPAWTYDIDRLEFDRAAVRYIDRPLDIDLRFALHPLAGAPAGASKSNVKDISVAATLTGRYKQAEVNAEGQGGALLGLLNDGALYPLRVAGDVGRVHVAVDGTLTNPHRLARADLKLSLSGETLADLYPATGVLLPPSRAFTTQGALSIIRGAGKPPVWDWRYTQFTGTVGESDFAGDAHYLRGGPTRPQLRTTFHSRLLRLADLVPPGAPKDNDSKKAAGEGKVLPAHEFEPGRWATLDAEIVFTGDQFALLPKLMLEQPAATIRLKDQVISIEPLRFTMAGGKAEGALSLDGRQERIRASLKLKAQALQVRQLFPGLGKVQASFGKLDGTAEINGSGNSIAAMLGSADGKIEANISEGSISQFILEAAGLNLADAVFARFYRDRQVRLLCAAADVRIARGQADMHQFVINTEDALLTVGGHANLTDETLDLNVHPHTKQLRVLSLRSPLTVTGSFAHPQIGARSGALAAKAGAAAALALVAPLAAVIPLITPGEDVPDDCRPRPANKARQTN